jgi:hypothetical protein
MAGPRWRETCCRNPSSYCTRSITTVWCSLVQLLIVALFSRPVISMFGSLIVADLNCKELSGLGLSSVNSDSDFSTLDVKLMRMASGWTAAPDLRDQIAKRHRVVQKDTNTD